MKQLLIGFLCLFLTTLLIYGCADKEYYLAQENAYKAQLEYLKQLQAKPMVEFTTPNNDKFTVNYPNIPIPQPNIRPLQNPVVDLINSIMGSPVTSILAGGWATKEIIKHSVGSTNVSGSSSYSTNSQNRSASDGGYVSEDNSTNNSTNDSYNQTAEPTIVEQPDYNDPIIVTQPPYNDPIIVGE